MEGRRRRRREGGREGGREGRREKRRDGCGMDWVGDKRVEEKSIDRGCELYVHTREGGRTTPVFPSLPPPPPPDLV